MSLDILPNELIECIAINLNYIDLRSLLQVNSRLNSFIVSNNGLWKRAFCKQWPTLYGEVFETLANKSEICWRSETIQCHLIGVKIVQELSKMSAMYHRKLELDESSFDIFRGLITDNRHNCVLDELETIVKSDNNMTKYNLTIKYYARKVLSSLRKESVHNKWTQMVQELNYKQIGPGIEPIDIFQPDRHDIPGDLIRGSVLIAQYCQPSKTVSETKIRQQIRVIARETVKIVQEWNPKNKFITQRHGALLTDSEASTLTESILEPTDCVEILRALNVAMYGGTSRFRGNRNEYYLATNSYIDKVLELKTGIPILLCILYQATAALLGVKLYPIAHPGHFMLAIRDKPNAREVSQQFTYIDPFNDGELSDQPTVNVSPNTIYAPIPCLPLAVFYRMALNLIEVARRGKRPELLRTFAELGIMVYERDTQLHFMLAQAYLAMDANRDRVLRIAQRFENHVEGRHLLAAVNHKSVIVQPPITVKHRPTATESRFAVGMVIQDNKYNCIGVICGWVESAVNSFLPDWRVQPNGLVVPSVNVQSVSYEVFLVNGTTRIASPEHLSICGVTNANELFPPEVGRYFAAYNGRNFVPNEELRAMYPDDEYVLDELYLKHLESLN